MEPEDARGTMTNDLGMAEKAGNKLWRTSNVVLRRVMSGGD